MPANLLEYLREWGITNSLWRKPTTAGSNLYPLFLEPQDGPPGPGEPEGEQNHPDLILSAMVTGGIQPNFYEHEFKKRVIELTFMARTAPLALNHESAVYALLADKWMGMDLAGLLILSVKQHHAIRRNGFMDDSRAWKFTTSYLMEYRAADCP